MKTSLFSFDFSNVSGVLFALIPSLVNLTLFFYVLYRLPRNKVTNVFALLTLCMFLWQMNDVLARLTPSKEVADIWNGILSASWIFIGALCLHFSVLYSQIIHQEHIRTLVYVIYVPAFIFMGIFTSHVFPHELTYSDFWGWVDNHDVYVLDKLIIHWISSLVIIATIVLFIHTYRVRHNPLLHFQSLWIAIGIGVPAFCGIITQVVFPIFLNIPAIPVTSTFMTFFSISTVIALKKYKLFTVSDLMSNERLIEWLPVAVLNISQNKRINFINDECVKLLFTDRRTVEQHRHFEEVLQFSKEIERRKFIAAWEAAMNGETIVAAECSLLTAKGVVDVVISAKPIINNGLIEGALICFRDITELRKSYRIVLESDIMLRKSQQMAHLGSWEWDVATGTVKWSDELYRIYGFSPGGVEVSFDKFIELVHPDDRTKTMGIVSAAIKNQNSFDFHYRITRTDGQERMIRGFGEMEMNEQGEVAFIKGTAQDVTLEKQHEEMLHKQNVELQKINSELDKFVYSVSHDLRSPLTSMLGLVQIMEDDAEDDAQKQNLCMLQECIVKLDKFIIDILDYSRNARTDISSSKVDIQAVIKEITSHLQFLLSFKIDLKVNILQTAPLYSDNTRVFIILNNLISNAYNYLDINKPNPSIRIDVTIDSTSCVIKIEDNGIGISSEHQHRIFEMFFRGTQVSRGSGLGLYIVKSSVEKLNGFIELNSEAGVGSTFAVTFPNLLEVHCVGKLHTEHFG